MGTIADSGFRPGRNGFSFENYGATLSDGTSPANLTPADVRTLFGKAVCADASIGRCDLIPEAQAWMDQMNQQMSGGHCFGFSVAADLVWQDKVDTAAFGAPTIGGLSIHDNSVLQSTIARGWVFQTFDSVQAGKVVGPPHKILRTLESVLKPNASETYTIAMWKRDGSSGHAVTPYQVINKGDGRVDVLIYDNNWPAETRAISFDTDKDTWSYHAAANPDDPTELYEGDSETRTIELLPTSPGRGTQPCPFCSKRSSAGSSTGTTGGVRTATIYLAGDAANHSHVLVTDEAGRRLGNVDGKIVNEIPGARYVLLTSEQTWRHQLQPILYVPANLRYTIRLDGRALVAPDSERIDIIGPAWHLGIDNIPMAPGDTDTLTVDPNATRLTYETTRAYSPTIAAAVSDARAHYAFIIDGVSTRPGSTVNVSVPTGRSSLVITDVGSNGTSSVRLQMTRSTEQGVAHFRHDGIALADGDAAELQYGTWTSPTQGVPLLTTHNGQRVTQMLTNE